MIKISVGDRGTLEKFKENKGKYRYALVGVEVEQTILSLTQAMNRIKKGEA